MQTLYEYKGTFEAIIEKMAYVPCPSNIKNLIEIGLCTIVKQYEFDRWGLGIKDNEVESYDHKERKFVLKFENIATYPLSTVCFIKDNMIFKPIDVEYNNCIIMVRDNTLIENLEIENKNSHHENSLVSNITYNNCITCGREDQ